jgi:hypothetical protein
MIWSNTKYLIRNGLQAIEDNSAALRQWPLANGHNNENDNDSNIDKRHGLTMLLPSPALTASSTGEGRDSGRMLVQIG